MRLGARKRSSPAAPLEQAQHPGAHLALHSHNVFVREPLSLMKP